MQYGRIGSKGQKNVKTFPNEAAKHADKLIGEKSGKLCQEVSRLGVA